MSNHTLTSKLVLFVIVIVGSKQQKQHFASTHYVCLVLSPQYVEAIQNKTDDQADFYVVNATYERQG